MRNLITLFLFLLSVNGYSEDSDKQFLLSDIEPFGLSLGEKISDQYLVLPKAEDYDPNYNMTLDEHRKLHEIKNLKYYQIINIEDYDHPRVMVDKLFKLEPPIPNPLFDHYEVMTTATSNLIFKVSAKQEIISSRETIDYLYDNGDDRRKNILYQKFTTLLKKKKEILKLLYEIYGMPVSIQNNYSSFDPRRNRNSCERFASYSLEGNIYTNRYFRKVEMDQWSSDLREPFDDEISSISPNDLYELVFNKPDFLTPSFSAMWIISPKDGTKKERIIISLGDFHDLTLDYELNYSGQQKNKAAESRIFKSNRKKSLSRGF